HLEVQVRARGAASATHAGDDLATFDRIADGDQVVDVMGVARHVAVAVVDLDQLAIAIAFAGPGDNARRHGDDLGAGSTREIDTLMEREAPGEGVGAAAEL